MASLVSKEEMLKQEKYIATVNSLIKGQGKKAFVYTLGCQQNEADSERIMALLLKMGYEKAQDEKEADILIVNTCAIRDHAEKRALSIIGRFKHYKVARPDIVIGVCGCMTAQKHRADHLKHSYHYVDFTFGKQLNICFQCNNCNIRNIGMFVKEFRGKYI